MQGMMRVDRFICHTGGPFGTCATATEDRAKRIKVVYIACSATPAWVTVGGKRSIRGPEINGRDTCSRVAGVWVRVGAGASTSCGGGIRTVALAVKADLARPEHGVGGARFGEGIPVSGGAGPS